MGHTQMPVAIGARLQSSRKIITLGLKPNFNDYTPEERDLILRAPKIYYPTAFYAGLFDVMGKPTFPSPHTYKFALDKINQTAIFNMLGVPHPRTKVYYGKKQKQCIADDFGFPFMAKQARGSSKGRHVFLVRNRDELDRYLALGGPAYIQEYLPIEKDMRVVVIGKKIRLAYWRKALKGAFKTNLAQGGTIVFDPLPQKALDLALQTAIQCQWDDIGLDLIEHQGRFYVIEANVKYGTKGFLQAGINYKEMLETLIVEGRV